LIRREEDGYWIVLREKIAAHHEDVFMRLVTSTGLVQWFPVTAQVDLRVGGTIAFGWDSKFQRRSTVAILDYDAGGKVVWDWYASVHDRHAPVYWEVTPSVEEGSHVEFRQGPFMSDEESMVAMAEEAASWQWRLCNLRSTVEAKHDMRSVRPL
jgi:uncharacterized protein YndB with AHSA1/START domain